MLGHEKAMKVRLITYEEELDNGRIITLVSHGVDEDLRNVVLPNEPSSHFSPTWDTSGPYIETEDR